jgi:hypothetical protein
VAATVASIPSALHGSVVHHVGVERRSNRWSAAAVLLLLLLPLLWLWPAVSGKRAFVPYDQAAYPPISLTLTSTELAAVADGANHDVTETPVWFLPELAFAGAELRAHARPVAPLHAHGLIGLGYPPNWPLLCVANPERWLWLPAWIDLALGGLFAFGLFRRLGIDRVAAWFGAVLFQLSGPMAANAFFWMRLGSFVWLPGLLWSLLCLAESERPRRRQIAAVAGCLAAPWLAGFPPFAATTTLLGAFAGSWFLLARLGIAGERAALQLAKALLFGALLGAALALPQVLPSLQFFPHSARSTSPSMAEMLDQQFERYGLLGYVLPDAFGHPTAQGEVPYGARNPLALCWNGRERDGKPALPNWNYTEYSLFVGQLGIALALVGALFGSGGRRRLALLSWLGCLGLAMCWPVVRELYRLPLVQNVWPMRWLAPATLFVAWLAALGLERLWRSGRQLPLLLAAAFAALLIGGRMVPAPQRWTPDDSAAFAQRIADRYGVDRDGAVAHVVGGDATDYFAAAAARLAAECARAEPWLWGAFAWSLGFVLWRDERRRRWLACVAGVAAIVQLGLHGRALTRGCLRAHATTTPVHKFLGEQAAARADTGGFMIARGDASLPLPSQLPPGQLLVPGIRDLQFYSHADKRFLEPLRRLLGTWLGTLKAGTGYLTAALPHTLPPAEPALAAEYDSGRQPRDYTTAHPFQSPLLDLYGVRYVLSVGDAPLPFVGASVAIAGAPQRFHVQERATALPRAFAVAEVRAHADDAAVIAAMLAPEFAPGMVAHALAAELPQPLPTAAPTAAQPRAVRFVADAPTRIELAVAAGPEPWLLLTDTFLPGWHATIDGIATQLVRGDHAFRLLRLPPNACTVVFSYTAPGLRTGIAIAISALGIFAAYAFATRRRSTRADTDQVDAA